MVYRRLRLYFRQVVIIKYEKLVLQKGNRFPRCPIVAYALCEGIESYHSTSYFAIFY